MQVVLRSLVVMTGPCHSNGAAQTRVQFPARKLFFASTPSVKETRAYYFIHGAGEKYAR